MNIVIEGMEDWKKLLSFNSEAEARVVESRLNSEGIEVQLLGSHSRAAGPVPDLLQLYVREPDYNRALEIIKAARLPSDP